VLTVFVFTQITGDNAVAPLEADGALPIYTTLPFWVPTWTCMQIPHSWCWISTEFVGRHGIPN